MRQDLIASVLVWLYFNQKKAFAYAIGVILLLTLAVGMYFQAI